MNKLNQATVRTAIAFLFMLLCAGFLLAGLTLSCLPALAANVNADLPSDNTHPIAENLELNTYKGVAVKGHFTANDPDGDSVTFEISDVPKKGTIEAGTDGSFIYTPADGKKGRDSFSYIAVDSKGNESDMAYVTINILRQATKITYADMADNGSGYAALALAENDIMIGEKLGNEYFFRPAQAVTRGEFLAMCLNLTGTETLDGVTRTGFYDDDGIPMWVKPYVSAALMNGIISGYKNDEGYLVFSSEEPITFSEAAVMLDNALGISDVSDVAALDNSVCPTWSYQSELNLTACNILQDVGSECSTKCVTRAEAADMIAASIDLQAERGEKLSLLDWAKHL